MILFAVVELCRMHCTSLLFFLLTSKPASKFGSKSVCFIATVKHYYSKNLNDSYVKDMGVLDGT